MNRIFRLIIVLNLTPQRKNCTKKSQTNIFFKYVILNFGTFIPFRSISFSHITFLNFSLSHILRTLVKNYYKNKIFSLQNIADKCNKILAKACSAFLDHPTVCKVYEVKVCFFKIHINNSEEFHNFEISSMKFAYSIISRQFKASATVT